MYPANEPRRLLNAFRVAAEGEFCNAQDEPIDLPADALIGIAHPLEMTAEMRSEFAQLFADYEIIPPLLSLIHIWCDMVSHRITGARCCSPAPICSLCRK